MVIPKGFDRSRIPGLLAKRWEWLDKHIGRIREHQKLRGTACLWLNDLLGSYAWPGDFDPLRANTAETRLGATTPVGVFPGGATPDTGLLDLCGNVWEWTATPWTQGEAWAPALGATDGEPGGRRVVRGGSWGITRAGARLGCRNNGGPDLRDHVLGFRVCRASHISTRLLMVACACRGPRARGVARPRPASKNMTRPRLGIAAQSV